MFPEKRDEREGEVLRELFCGNVDRVGEEEESERFRDDVDIFRFAQNDLAKHREKFDRATHGHQDAAGVFRATKGGSGFNRAFFQRATLFQFQK